MMPSSHLARTMSVKLLLLAFAAFIVLEQVLLVLVVGPAAEKDFLGQSEFISKIQTAADEDRHVTFPFCESKAVWRIYRYQLCIGKIDSPTGVDEANYSIGGIRPPGVLQMIYGTNADRVLWDGFLVAELDADFQVVKKR